MPLTLPASKSQHNRIRSVTIGVFAVCVTFKAGAAQLTLLIGANGVTVHLDSVL